ncbi:MAG: hypothetical protein M5R40_07235 [Anaerolineae bacterium]|nr:hypothetical protein [Anaerolineae bacterium]
MATTSPAGIVLVLDVDEAGAHDDAPSGKRDAAHNPDLHADRDADHGDAGHEVTDDSAYTERDAPALGDATALDHPGADAHAGSGDRGVSAADAGGRPTLALQLWGAGRGGSETP